MSVIRKSGDHLLAVIEGTLDIARIEGGKLTLDVKPLDFPEVLRQIIDEVMYVIRELSGQEYVNEYAAGRKPAPVEPVIDLRPTPEPAAEAELRPVPARNGSGGANGHTGTNGHNGHKNGHSEPVAAPANADGASDAEDSEFVRATRPRSSADVLRNPPRRAHLTT